MSKADHNDANSLPAPARPAGSDWESVALSRVARRVEALGVDADAMALRRNESTSAAAATDDFGWEESVLKNLRRRLAET